MVIVNDIITITTDGGGQWELVINSRNGRCPRRISKKKAMASELPKGSRFNNIIINNNIIIIIIIILVVTIVILILYIVQTYNWTC